MTPAEYADRCRAGISRLREQAEAALAPKPHHEISVHAVGWDGPAWIWRCTCGEKSDNSGDVEHYVWNEGESHARWHNEAPVDGVGTAFGEIPATLALLVLDGWERQLARDEQQIALHDGLHVCPSGEGGSTDYDAWTDGYEPCPSATLASESIADLARLVDQIGGTP